MSDTMEPYTPFALTERSKRDRITYYAEEVGSLVAKLRDRNPDGSATHRAELAHSQLRVIVFALAQELKL